MVTDPIADMLTRVRNAAHARHRRVDMPGAREPSTTLRTLAQSCPSRRNRGVSGPCQGRPPAMAAIASSVAASAESMSSF